MQLKPRKFILTPFLAGLILPLITCVISAVIHYVEGGFNYQFRILSLVVVFVLPAFIWLEQWVAGNLKSRIKAVVLIESIALVLFFLMLGRQHFKCRPVAMPFSLNSNMMGRLFYYCLLLEVGCSCNEQAGTKPRKPGYGFTGLYIDSVGVMEPAGKYGFFVICGRLDKRRKWGTVQRHQNDPIETF